MSTPTSTPPELAVRSARAEYEELPFVIRRRLTDSEINSVEELVVDALRRTFPLVYADMALNDMMRDAFVLRVIERSALEAGTNLARVLGTCEHHTVKEVEDRVPGMYISGYETKENEGGARGARGTGSTARTERTERTERTPGA